jgi:hypothetical protein
LTPASPPVTMGQLERQNRQRPAEEANSLFPA